MIHRNKLTHYCKRGISLIILILCVIGLMLPVWLIGIFFVEPASWLLFFMSLGFINGIVMVDIITRLNKFVKRKEINFCNFWWKPFAKTVAINQGTTIELYDYGEIEEWIEQNATGRWEPSKKLYVYFFEKEVDALAFKLTWS